LAARNLGLGAVVYFCGAALAGALEITYYPEHTWWFVIILGLQLAVGGTVWAARPICCGATGCFPRA